MAGDGRQLTRGVRCSRAGPRVVYILPQIVFEDICLITRVCTNKAEATIPLLSAVYDRRPSGRSYYFYGFPVESFAFPFSYRFLMRRYSPPYHSPPRRGYGGRGRSPPRRGYGGGYGGKEQGSGSLLVRNIPLNCRPEDLRAQFDRFGPVRDVYLPKNYYSGEPRGFAFIEFVDPYDASEAQYHMNRQVFGGREITVVVAAESRKRPDEMRKRGRVRTVTVSFKVTLTLSPLFFKGSTSFTIIFTCTKIPP